jgi:tetratricopeptide (TPR) repeat protein
MTSRALVVLFLLAVSAVAQRDTGTVTRRVQVKVAFTTGGCDSPTHVTLAAENRSVAEANVNDKCEVNFAKVPLGSYHLIVSGQTFSATDSGNIDVTSVGKAKFGVTVKRAKDFDWNYGLSSQAFVAASDLAVPARARKEFDKANELLAKQDFAQAAQKFNKAIALYPSYAVAYNNLGVIYARLSEPQREREALEKAIGIDDHFALAYTNLGRMKIAASDFSGAAAALQRASALDPTEGVTLLLLAYAELMEQRFNDAVATSRRAHAVQDHPAFVHRIAARALEEQRDITGAIAELERFLEEEPSGHRADAVRKELEIVQALPR